jgi:transcriptional regulator with XRE-family HTH domain
MTYIGKNIKKIRTVKNLSQAAFAHLFHLARPSVGAYEEGRSEPKMETVMQIAQYFGLSIDLLLSKELTINELYGFDIFKKELKKDNLLKRVAEGAEKPTYPETAFVKVSQMMEYLVHHQDADFSSQLPAVRFPEETKTTTRAFEVPGSEMLYEQHGLHHGDVVFCTAVGLDDLVSLQPGQVYVVVTVGQLLVRRLLETGGRQKLTLKADNPDYPIVEVPLTEVRELWEVQGVYSTFLRPPTLLEERLALLESTIQQLSRRVRKLEE